MVGPNDDNEGVSEELKASSVTIGNKVWIGANATILSRGSIGDKAVIAAGVVYTHNCWWNTSKYTKEIWRMIPKVIHYCWFGHNKLPSDTKKFIETWKKYCPNYEIKEWNESNFDIDSCKFVREAYDNKAWAFVSDYARLKVIYDNGGIYLDTDVELLKNIDFLLDTPFFACIGQEGLCNTGRGYGAEAGNPVVLKMMSIYESMEFEPENKEQIACPIINDSVIKSFGYTQSNEVEKINGMTILPPRYMDPFAPGSSRNLLNDDTISIHHYSASWTPGKNRLKRKLFNTIGLERITKLKEIINREK